MFLPVDHGRPPPDGGPGSGLHFFKNRTVYVHEKKPKSQSNRFPKTTATVFLGKGLMRNAGEEEEDEEESQKKNLSPFGTKGGRQPGERSYLLQSPLSPGCVVYNKLRE